MARAEVGDRASRVVALAVLAIGRSFLLGLVTGLGVASTDITQLEVLLGRRRLEALLTGRVGDAASNA